MIGMWKGGWREDGEERVMTGWMKAEWREDWQVQGDNDRKVKEGWGALWMKRAGWKEKEN
jgi:hypothetical protein